MFIFYIFKSSEGSTLYKLRDRRVRPSKIASKNILEWALNGFNTRLFTIISTPPLLAFFQDAYFKKVHDK